MSAKVKLAKVTGNDLSEEEVAEIPSNYKQVLNPSPVSAGTTAPKISDAVQALLIMNGCHAQWIINYWRVTRRVEPGQAPIGVKLRPGQKWRIQTGASADADFAEWQSILKAFVAEPVGV